MVFQRHASNRRGENLVQSFIELVQYILCDVWWCGATVQFYHHLLLEVTLSASRMTANMIPLTTCFLIWRRFRLATVSNTFQDLEFDGSL